MDPRTEQMLAERAQKTAATPAPLRGPLRSLHDARHWVKTHPRRTKFVAGAFGAVLIAASYLIVVLPAQRADRLEMESRAADRLKTETTSRQATVSACLTKAKIDADARWAAACKTRREGADCPLPERQADAFQRDERTARNACLLVQ